jgi:peroxiredoxin Q/BCP
VKSLKKGDMVPDFSLKDQNGNLFDISAIRGKKKMVIFFYPEDGSYGCTREACYFRDLHESFAETDAVIIGISGQSVESHKAFAEQFKLKYPILSDEGDRIRKLFGVPSHFFGLMPGRVTYVADKDGRIAHIFSSQTQVERHVDEALKIVLLLKKIENGQT